MAGHGHVGELPRATPHMRRVIVAVLVPLVLATIAGLVLLWPTGEAPRLETGIRTDATILDIRPCGEFTAAEAADADGDQVAGECREAEVSVAEGPDAGIRTLVPLPFGAGAPTFEVGDEIVLSGMPDFPLDSRYEVFDFQRSAPLLLLGAVFAAAVVALSGWKGVTALAGLGVSILVLVLFMLPALLEGAAPLPVAVVGSSVIMITTLYLAHGVSVRTSVALIGTLISLTLTGLLGSLFTTLGHFTGLADESVAYLGTIGAQIDVRGLLLAGLVIGALGVLDDVTVTQAAAVWEVAAADPASSRRTLFASGLRIGRDHVAATVNTLVLAYAGASLPLLMLFAVAEQGAIDIITTELVAQEVVRALVGGLGIVAAVPITTGLAVLSVRRRTVRSRGRRAAPAEVAS